MGAYGSPNLNSNTSYIFVKCPHCGKETAKSYSRCPNCGKPMHKFFYQKWYFWVIMVIIGYFLYVLWNTPADKLTPFLETNNNISNNISTETAEEKAIREKKIKDKFIDECKVYTYDELARYPDKFKGLKTKVVGKVDQVITGQDYTAFRINITKTKYGYKDTIYATYQYAEGDTRMLVDDIVEIYGICRGEVTYNTVQNTSITVPYVQVKYYNIKSD